MRDLVHGVVLVISEGVVQVAHHGGDELRDYPTNRPSDNAQLQLLAPFGSDIDLTSWISFKFALDLDFEQTPNGMRVAVRV
ncbi:hypothetical protein EON65_18855 [archaeon]|nr:MAG: hypothetical protein EON65_18855 [archaeon]